MDSCQQQHQTQPETRALNIVEAFTRSTEYSDEESTDSDSDEDQSHTIKNKWPETDEESSSSWMNCDEETLPWMKEDSSTRAQEEDEPVHYSNSSRPILKSYQHQENVSVASSSLPSNEDAVVLPSYAGANSPHTHCSSSAASTREFTTASSVSNPTNEKIRVENRRLKKEVCRLREEAREKDALISILESQIMALVVDGRENSSSDNSKSSNSNKNNVSSSNKNSNKNSSSKVVDDQDDDIESLLESTPEWIKSSAFTTISSVASSLSLPRRSSIEMKHPPAPTQESHKRNSSSSSKKAPRKNCFQKSTAAIMALPRELSISNHSNCYLLEDGDGSKVGTVEEKPKRQKAPSETYEVTKMEFIDAYNARGIYSGTVQRATQMPHGKGKMVYHRGGRVGSRYYDGDWHLGHWHGYGILRDASGDIYEGQVVNDLREGLGTIQFTDGRIFQGIFRNDEASNGTMSYIDGAQYEGELHHGNRHGWGVYRFSDGSYYEGESVMNLFEGRGKMTWSDGGWYEGDWSKGEIHGFGKEYRPDGTLRHDGRWIKGVPIRIKNYCRR